MVGWLTLTSPEGFDLSSDAAGEVLAEMGRFMVSALNERCGVSTPEDEPDTPVAVVVSGDGDGEELEEPEDIPFSTRIPSSSPSSVKRTDEGYAEITVPAGWPAGRRDPFSDIVHCLAYVRICPAGPGATPEGTISPGQVLGLVAFVYPGGSPCDPEDVISALERHESYITIDE